MSTQNIAGEATRKNLNIEKTVAGILLFLLVISLIPLMYLGRYNHPTGDDYYYGVDTRLVWEETGKVGSVLAEACVGVAEQYQIWQGTYSAMFLMYLPPNIWGESAYFLVTPVIMLLLVTGIFYLLKPLMCEVAGNSTSLWCIASSVVSMLCIQTVPSQGETFFWYNGAMYYTGFLAVSFLFWGMLCRYLLRPRIWRLIVMGVLAVFLAGGNYVSLLPTMIILFGLWMVLLYEKKGSRTIGIGITLGLLLAGFAVSALAPGNQVRQDGMWKISAIEAILKSLRQGVRYSFVWIGIWWLIGALILLPFLWRSYQKCKFRFPWPVVVIGLTYGIFCSMSCPLFYTMNSTGPARAVSIVYYGFILATFFCYYYFLGYVHRVLTERKAARQACKRTISSRVLAVSGGAMVGILLLIQAVTGAMGNCSTSKALRILSTGEARAYHEEFLQRLALLQDDSVRDIVFEPYTHQPDMLFVGDLPGYPEEPTNQRVAWYFHKDSVYVKYE